MIQSSDDVKVSSCAPELPVSGRFFVVLVSEKSSKVSCVQKRVSLSYSRFSSKLSSRIICYSPIGMIISMSDYTTILC